MKSLNLNIEDRIRIDIHVLGLLQVFCKVIFLAFLGCKETVKNCIIMQVAQMQEGAEIDHCILDKQSVIRRNGRLIAPAAYPIVIAKNVVI